MQTNEPPVLAEELGTLATLDIEDTSTTTDTSSLSRTERQMLEHHETIIDQGRLTVLEVGRSLLAIQRGKLYRAEYASFNEYCRERWGIGRQRGYELMNAAITSQELAEAGVQIDQYNERQLRPLASLENTDQRALALARAQELAGEKKLTGRHVDKAVKELKGIATPAPAFIEVVQQPVAKLKVNVEGQSGKWSPCVTKEDIFREIDGILEIAISIKAKERFEEPLELLKAMIETYEKEKEFAGTILGN